MATSKKDASKAGKLLSDPKTPKSVKSVAASDLAQIAKKKGQVITGCRSDRHSPRQGWRTIAARKER